MIKGGSDGRMEGGGGDGGRGSEGGGSMWCVWCDGGGKQQWVLTYCCPAFVGGWSSSYMDGHLGGWICS